MYYIQVGSFSKAESVETELTKIGRNWPLAVQRAGTPESPLYRILVGPVNLGESGAIFQRLKTTYTDAFVRVGS
jgi:cell division septation protein DedD